MSEIQTGGPAFPVSTQHPDNGHQDSANTWQFPGMTLRDYFAAKAMHALLVSYGTYQFDVRAIQAYEAADAMLKARAEGGAA